jgi:hypothetical protein
LIGWGDESSSDLTRDPGSCRVSGVVVVSHADDDARPERRRRKCLEQLLLLLSVKGCSRLILESRGRRDDPRDRNMLDHVRRSHGLPNKIYLDHAPGPTDPALWAADALCGAVVADRTGANRVHLTMIKTGVHIDTIIF